MTCDTRQAANQMQFVMLIPYTDLAHSTPLYWVGSFTATSEEEAWRAAHTIGGSVSQVLDLVVGRDAYDSEEFVGLEGEELLMALGLRLGEIHVWSLGQLGSVNTIQLGGDQHRGRAQR